MNESIVPRKTSERIEQIRKERQAIMALPAEKALDTILNSPQPAPLVHSFPEEDLYMLVNEVGLDDALPLLSLASNNQWEYFIDMNIWHADRLNADALTFWIGLLLKADSKRLMQWGVKQKTELFELYLSKYIEIHIREHDQDPADFGPEYVSIDGTFYIRISSDPSDLENEKEKQIQKQRTLIITHFLNFLASLDLNLYHSILMETSGVIPSESEEELLRRRNVRLAEKGFLPFEEAIQVYTPLTPDDLVQKGQKSKVGYTDDPLHYPVPLYSSRLLEEETVFSRSLMAIGSGLDLQQIQIEFAALCNQIISADRIKVTDKKELAQVVRKTAAYLSIGLERLSAVEPLGAEQSPGAYLTKYPLSQIFRVGFQLALSLKWQAEKWYHASWFESMGLPLSFWDDQGMGLIGGLLLKKPLFFNNYDSGDMYREFHTQQEIRTTKEALKTIMAFDDLFSQMPIELPPGLDRFLTYKKLLLTLWGRHYLKLPQPLAYEALSIQEFKNLHAALFMPLDATSSHPSYQIPVSMKASCLTWLTEQTGMPQHDISARLAGALETLFKELEEEYALVSRESLAPRLIKHFAVEGE
jgi:hypothetical protein